MSEADLRDVSALYIEFEQRAVVESVRHGDESWEIRVLSSYHRLARLEALTREERIERSAEWLECHRAFHLELRSEEHTSELQSLMRISYAVFCLKKKKKSNNHTTILYSIIT